MKTSWSRRSTALGVVVGLMLGAFAFLIGFIFSEAPIGEATVAAGTLALAVATAWLGWQTRELARRTVEVAERAELRRERELLVAVAVELGENLELLRTGLAEGMRTTAWDAARGVTLPGDVEIQLRLAYDETKKLATIHRRDGRVKDDPTVAIAVLVVGERFLREHLGLETDPETWRPQRD